MEPLQPATVIRPPVKDFIQNAMAIGFTREQAKIAYNRFGPDTECWKNALYTVLVKRGLDIEEDMNPERSESLVWLSIRRNDRKPVTDWRHKQEMKNQLIGPECEAVEIYPAESRLMDSANQYHLFGYDNGARLPFGFPHRLTTNATICNSQQRPLDE